MRIHRDFVTHTHPWFFFLLDVYCGRIDLAKGTYQNRAHILESKFRRLGGRYDGAGLVVLPKE